jgi:imidazolonepropionase-like amidohydrolase
MPRDRRDLLLEGGHVLDPATGRDEIADVLVRDGNIEAIGRSLGHPDGAEILDCTGAYVAPGLIDVHCHLRSADDHPMPSGAECVTETRWPRRQRDAVDRNARDCPADHQRDPIRPSLRTDVNHLSVTPERDRRDREPRGCRGAVGRRIAIPVAERLP